MFRRLVALIELPLALSKNMAQRVDLEVKQLDLCQRRGLDDAREGEGESPIDKEREEEESNDSLIFPAPLFLELDAFINRVTLEEM